MIKIYRQRYLPKELLWLKDDEILLHDDEVIVTRWRSIKPRLDFSHGRSCYFLHRNYKISQFFDQNDLLLYYYCDIVMPDVAENGDIIFRDLLVDVKVYPDGSHTVLDLDELAEALEKGLVSDADVIIALNTLDSLLKSVYADEFGGIAKILDDWT